MFNNNIFRYLETIERINRFSQMSYSSSAYQYLSGQYVKQATEIFRAWTENGVFRITEMMNQFHRNINEFGNINQQYSAIMVELGWPPYGGLYIPEMKKIIKAYNRFGPEAIREKVDQLFIERFDADEIEKLSGEWGKKKWLAKRMPIIRQAVTAHNAGNYYLSVPAILPQIEGIIVDGYCHNGRMPGKMLKEYYKKLLDESYRYSFDQKIQEFLFHIILVDFEHGITPKSFLSRHAILHGGDTDYGTVTNSLKLILLFDYLQGKLGIVTLPSSHCYHLVGCPVVRRFKNRNPQLEIKPYGETYAVEKRNKPCKICKPNIAMG
ncbi:hypothetical protein [Anaeroselena agilis]|uniref:Uncharacterized protein n=1 Tax=Anaeroselena agilis TaxID=3063788 RepID=A0ABU3NU50_9FIRM|nr:hypothetical protein [Selenomonadales bacterium 4137-cl]